MPISKLRSGLEVDDEEFDAIYPERWKKISGIHFTPVRVALAASRYLVEKPGAFVLDIGSGSGKFCMVGAAVTQGNFVGVEQRRSLYLLAKRLSKKHHFPNIGYLHSNIMAIDFEAYDSIYYFNAFYENISQSNPIDTSVPLDKTLYIIYCQYVREQLSKKPIGTRLATYFSFLDEIPESYKIQATDFDSKLKLWEKKG